MSNDISTTKTKNSLNILTTIIYLSVALVFIIVFLLIWSGDKNINLFGYMSYNVLTDSMRPTFDAGTFIIVKTDIDKQELNIQDIITFVPNTSRDTIKVTHRIIDKQIIDGKISYITRGDCNTTDDPPITPDQIIGKVVFHIDGVGEFLWSTRNFFDFFTW